MASAVSKALLAGLLALLIPSSSAAQHCGKERWPVKTLVDDDASSVEFHAEPTTVSELLAIPAPETQLPQATRLDPTELTVFRVRAVLTLVKKETDGDYHLVIADPDDPEATMIAEVPNPGCASGSGYEATFKKLRALLTPLLKLKTVERTIEIDGVGFFDFLHNQTGVARNGIELHPVVRIVFP
jgi:hypothetical protein